MNRIVQKIGVQFIGFIQFIINLIFQIPEEIRIIIKFLRYRKQLYKTVFYQELYYNGVLSVPIILALSSVISFFFIKLYPFNQLSQEVDAVYGVVFYIFILREISPLLVLFVIVIRATIFITIQTAQMKIGGEVQILETIGIDPYIYLGTIRVFAGILLSILLGFYFLINSVIVAAFAAWFFYDKQIGDFILEIVRQIMFKDVLIIFIKLAFSGFIIYKIALYNGLTSLLKRNMIITRTIRAIAQSTIALFVISLSFSVIFYG